MNNRTDTHNPFGLLRNAGPGAGTDACSIIGALRIDQSGNLFRYTGDTVTPWQQVLAANAMITTDFPVTVPMRTVVGNGAAPFVMPSTLGAVEITDIIAVLDAATDQAITFDFDIGGTPIKFGAVPVSLSIAAPGGFGATAQGLSDTDNVLNAGDLLTVTRTGANTLAATATIILGCKPA